MKKLLMLLVIAGLVCVSVTERACAQFDLGRLKIDPNRFKPPKIRLPGTNPPSSNEGSPQNNEPMEYRFERPAERLRAEADKKFADVASLLRIETQSDLSAPRAKFSNLVASFRRIPTNSPGYEDTVNNTKQAADRIVDEARVILQADQAKRLEAKRLAKANSEPPTPPQSPRSSGSSGGTRANYARDQERELARNVAIGFINILGEAARNQKQATESRRNRDAYGQPAMQDAGVRYRVPLPQNQWGSQSSMEAQQYAFRLQEAEAAQHRIELSNRLAAMAANNPNITYSGPANLDGGSMSHGNPIGQSQYANEPNDQDIYTQSLANASQHGDFRWKVLYTVDGRLTVAFTCYGDTCDLADSEGRNASLRVVDTNKQAVTLQDMSDGTLVRLTSEAMYLASNGSWEQVAEFVQKVN